MLNVVNFVNGPNRPQWMVRYLLCEQTSPEKRSRDVSRGRTKMLTKIGKSVLLFYHLASKPWW